jgi:hypothetical protein
MAAEATEEVEALAMVARSCQQASKAGQRLLAA